MCNLFSSPSAPAAPEPVAAAPVPAAKAPAKVKAAKVKEKQKEVNTAAVKSNEEQAKKKGRKSFRIQLGGYSANPKNGSGSGLSL